ncbi:MAG: hypothetical protein H6Q33_282 [Deltaproteobacteria bacterium]|nr:hypothetical protein [Deltaproteobacteria bacterium]
MSFIYIYIYYTNIFLRIFTEAPGVALAYRGYRSLAGGGRVGEAVAVIV